jgi:hypothetical protein
MKPSSLALLMNFFPVRNPKAFNRPGWLRAAQVAGNR